MGISTENDNGVRVGQGIGNNPQIRCFSQQSFAPEPANKTRYSENDYGQTPRKNRPIFILSAHQAINKLSRREQRMVSGRSGALRPEE